MSIYYIGLFTSIIGGCVVVLALMMLACRMAWFLYQEVVGWPRIVKALKMLNASERKGGEA